MTNHPRNLNSKDKVSRKIVDKLLLLFSLCVFLGVFLWFTSNLLKKYLNINEVHVPDLRGIQFEEAQRILEKLELTMNFYPENNPSYAFNSVISQNPVPYTIIRQGRKVSLGINLPSQEVTVPNIIGMLQEEAVLLLEGLGLNLGEVSYDSSELSQGAIISSDPPAQSVLSGDSSLNIVVSRGPSAQRLTMPQLVGLPLQDAKNRLQALGIRRIDTAINTVNRSRLGTVTGQHPEAGKSVFGSSSVTLYHTLSDPNVVAVPNVIGLTLQEAQTKLQSVGLDVRSQWLQYKTDPNKAEGIVEQRPTGYTLIGTPVALIVNGLPVGANVLNSPYSSQINPTVNAYPPPEQPIGSVPLGSPVNPSISSSYPSYPSYPPPSSPTISGTPPIAQPYPNPDVTNSSTTTTSISSLTTAPNSRNIPITFNPASYGFLQGQTNEYKLVIIDDRGERDEVRQTLHAGESINTYVTVYGQAELRTYINDSFFQAWNP